MSTTHDWEVYTYHTYHLKKYRVLGYDLYISIPHYTTVLPTLSSHWLIERPALKRWLLHGRNDTNLIIRDFAKFDVKNFSSKALEAARCARQPQGLKDSRTQGWDQRNQAWNIWNIWNIWKTAEDSKANRVQELPRITKLDFSSASTDASLPKDPRKSSPQKANWSARQSLLQ